MVVYSILASLIITTALLARAFARQRAESQRLSHRFRKVIDADEEARRIRDEANEKARGILSTADAEASKVKAALVEAQRLADAELESARQSRQRIDSDRARLLTEYHDAKGLYDRLTKEVRLLEENLEDISYGVYRPHFTFHSSKEYKEALEDLWKKDKEMVRSGLAAKSEAEWQVGGSKKEGERMTKQYLKLLVRAFNAECDACMARVSWNNHDVMEARIRKSFDALNKLGSTMQMSICEPYLELKLLELQFTHEHEEKLQEEKEDARRAREQMREEEKVQRELAAAAEKAEKEERSAARDLEKARREAENAADDAEKAVLAGRIQELEAQLASAHSDRERVVAQAQLTRCGHVYVLSNIGAFGEEIVKIGMTRRLEPRERVAELGDASVPFPFDLHALVYTEDAPKLETEMHNRFWDRRINLANDRKEFFKVPLAEIEGYLKEQGFNCTFEAVCEAKEYRLTCSERAKRDKSAQPPGKADLFPTELFAPVASIRLGQIAQEA